MQTAIQFAPATDVSQELEALIYPHGRAGDQAITFHEDPGHGWLQVPKSLCDSLGISRQISGYSYQRGQFYYLEEDCDYSLFLEALITRYSITDRSAFFKQWRGAASDRVQQYLFRDPAIPACINY